VRDVALPLTLCALLVLSGCSLLGGAGTPAATNGTASPSGTQTPTFGPAVYDAADAAAATDRLRAAGSWNATLTTRYESNRSRPDLDEYPIDLALRANTSVGHLQVTERRSDGRIETTFADDAGGYVRDESADGDVDYRWASRPDETLLVDALTARALAGTRLRFVDDPGELPLAKVGYREVDGESVAVYETNASESGFDAERSLLVPEEARLVRYEQRLTLASDGRLVGRTVTIEWVRPDRGERVTYQRSFRLEQVSGVTVERPEWVDEARQTADESAEER
jgi:hypothetical protein